MQLIVALSTLICLTTAVAVYSEPDSEGLRTVQVRDNIYMVNGAGGNVGVSIGADGVLLVDSKPAQLTHGLRTALIGLQGGRLVYLLNTHFHPDHVGGNPELGTQGTIIAHSRTRQRLVTGPEPMKRFFQAPPEAGLPGVTFEESLSLHFNGETITATHYPHSHTDGDIAISFTGSHVVHLGDLFFNGLFPFVDLDYGGDVEGLTRVVASLVEELAADTKIIPGHGPLGTLDDLKLYHRMLVETTATIRAAMQAGKSLRQIQQEGLPEEWRDWDWPYVPTRRWIEIVYWSLGRPSTQR